MPDGAARDAEDLAASVDDPACFKGVFERHVDGIYRYLAARLGGDLAEELTAEVFSRAFRGRDGYRPERGTVRAWLYGIATNVLRHHRRDEHRRAAILAGAAPALVAPAADDAGRTADRLALARALDGLRPDSRRVVLLIGLAGLSYEEAATALAIPVGTVRSRYGRARKRLAAVLADPAGPDPRRAAR